MSDLEINNNDPEYSTPPEIAAAAEEAKSNILPKKSREKYELAYRNFMDWRSDKKLQNFSENVLLAYMKHLSETKKPSTVWSIYSMLRSTLSVKNNIKINGYINLIAFLKGNAKGFQPKKSSVFTSEEIKKFFLEAPNEKFLAIKVAMIFGVYGACRLEELTNLKEEDIEEQGDLLLVKIPKTKTEVSRSFVIGNEYLNLIKIYRSLRPPKASTNRFFLYYKDEKCTSQAIGRNSFAKMPQIIAEYLNISNADTYTGHCFRRTSATLLANSGATMSDMKRHGAWKSPTVVEGYIADCVGQKTKTMRKIASEIDLPSTSSHSNLQFQKSGLMRSNSTIQGARKSQTVEPQKKITEEIEFDSNSTSNSNYSFSFPEFNELEMNNPVNETTRISNSSSSMNTSMSKENSVNKVLSGQDIHFHLSGCSNFNINIHTHKT